MFKQNKLEELWAQLTNINPHFPQSLKWVKSNVFLLETLKSFMEIHTIVQEEMRMQYGNTLFINGKIHV
jgi:hypothetical protein